MAIPFLGVLGWAFVPHHATKQLLGLYHYVLVRFFRRKAPPAGTFEYQRHYRWAFAVVVLGYLIYTLIQSSNNTLPNYYEILGVVPTADENALKLAFRQFAKKYHPDRVGAHGEALFIAVRDAFEALKNPTVRFAYDRFGPDVLRWKQCSTPAEYLRNGLTHSAGYHIVAGAFLVLWTAIGDTSPVAFWRYVLYVSLLASEMALILAPSPSATPSSFLLGPLSPATAEPTHRSILHVLFPRRVAYQHVLFLHQLFLFLSIALTRVAPQFFPDASKVTAAMTQRLLQLVGAADREVSQLLHTELHALQPSAEHVPLGRLRPVTEPAEDVMDMLSAEMEKMLIEGAVKRDGGPFKSVWEAAVEKGRRMLAAAVLTSRPPPPTTPSRGFVWGNSPLKKGPVTSPMNGHGGRMSPPPPPSPSLDRPGYVRARSISLV